VSVEQLKDDDRRVSLTALRDLLADTIVTADPQHQASLAKQYRDTLDALNGLEDTAEGDELDELRSRREAKPEVPARARRSGKRRAAGD
jgi:hypothetical protein